MFSVLVDAVAVMGPDFIRQNPEYLKACVHDGPDGPVYKLPSGDILVTPDGLLRWLPPVVPERSVSVSRHDADDGSIDVAHD